MIKLEEYIQGTYIEDKRRIRNIYEIITEVIPVFDDFWDETNQKWPYEVKDNSDDPQQSDIKPISNELHKDFSISTYCMILFSLEVLLTSSNKTQLIQIDIRPPDWKVYMDKQIKEKKTNFKKWQKRLSISRNALIDRISLKLNLFENLFGSWIGPLTSSKSYGNDDPLTLTWLLEIMLRWTRLIDNSEDKRNIREFGDADKVRRFKELILSAAKQVCNRFDKKLGHVLDLEPGYLIEIPNTFLQLRVNIFTKLYSDLTETEFEPLFSIESFENTIQTHLAYSRIQDSRYDPAQLAFALEGALQIDKHAFNLPTLETIFQILKDSQIRDIGWRPSVPFLYTTRGMVQFPVSVEVANSLLRSCSILDEPYDPTFFSNFEPQFRRYNDWLQARIERGTYVQSDKKKNFAGWHSEHINEPGTIHLWETSQVLLFMMQYASMLQKKLAADGLRNAGLTLKGNQKKSNTYWSEEPCKSDEWFSENSPYLVLDNTYNRYIVKLKQHCAILLYGPPGTGKTTYAEQMAAHLDRALLVITVSDFLAGGSAEVEARAKNIFKVLNEQQDIVILFDEIDQFLLDRNIKEYKEQTGIFKFMTPGMLTKLQDLKDTKNNIFIIATNYEERIDGAIKRQGRIDEQMLLSLPNQRLRLYFLKKFFKDCLEEFEYKIYPTGPDTESKEKDLDQLDRDLESALNKLAQNTVYFGYGDLKYLVETVLDEKQKDLKLPGLVKLVSGNVENTKPSVNLSNYKTRFYNENGETRNDPKPYEEFFLLVYLLHESGLPVEQEHKEVIELATKCLGDIKKLDSQKIIKDTKLAKKIIEVLKNILKEKKRALNGKKQT